MVASLQHKKEALEAKIREKNSELRKLCIEEAELTGFLPAETPLEPGESPPQFRRRVGTAFTYPESLINKLKSNEDEALAALELECKVQTGIAEAALGLANDATASKSVRRKHRLLYEESQRRLSELEARLNALRLAQPKQKKKPRPQTEIEGDCVDGGETETIPEQQGRFSKNSHHQYSENVADKYPGLMKNSHTFAGFQKSDPNLHPYHQRVSESNMVLPNMIVHNMDYRHSVMVPEFHHHLIRSSNPSPNNLNEVWWPKGREPVNLTHGSVRQSPLLPANPQEFYLPESSVLSDRFGSLDRNAQILSSYEHDNRLSTTLPRNAYMTPGSNAPSILLPNQTYPENSLMRTQSLGSVDNSKQHPERKAKEKEWFESSLDSSPPKATSKMGSPIPPIPQNEEKTLSHHYENNNTKMNQASINSIQFDTVVPYESPKNHTVVQAGKWQPYREVTKPFEMSDFYKYSTKYRKSQTQTQSNANGTSLGQQQQPQQMHLQHQQLQCQQQQLQKQQTLPQQIINQQIHPQQQQYLQQKGIYKPLQHLECQPLQHSSFGRESVTLKMSPHGNTPASSQIDSRYQNELITWYHDKNNSPKPRSSTLV